MITLKIDNIEKHEIANLETIELLNLDLQNGTLLVTFDENRVDMGDVLSFLKKELNVAYTNINQVV